MKFNWGTGIFIFLAVFLLSAAAFMIFAFKQDVNLVHKDYYDKGVDYTDQMNASKRSKEYIEFFHEKQEDGVLALNFDDELSSKIDSGSLILFRPSDSQYDLKYNLLLKDSGMRINKSELIPGRYILKLSWYHNNLKFEIDKPINIY